MDRLWTPWRMQYVTGSTTGDTPGNRADIFLNALETADDPDSLVVHRDEHSFVIMNLFPYNSGHTMVVPNRRVSALNELTPDERSEMFELVSKSTEVATSVLRCDGFNIGLNIGSVAGAGIAEHLHIHVVPRWTGDANFMPITADTMVLPELLPATTARIRGEFAARAASSAESSIESTAGAIVYVPSEDKVVLRRSADGSIVIPKGHIEDGESAADAAIREVAEETGFRATITNWAGIDRFEHNGRMFHTVYFVAVGSMTAAVNCHLGTDTILADPDVAVESVSFESLRTLIERGNAVARIRQGPEEQPA